MIEGKKNPDCRELRVLATTGRIFRLKVAETRALILSPRFAAALTLFCALLALVDPLIFQKPVILPLRILFWVFNGMVAVTLWYGLFRLALWWVTVSGRDIAIPSALMITLAVAGLLHVNYGIGMIALDNPDLWRGRLYPDVARYSIVAILFEAAVAALLVPGMLRALRWKSGATGRGAEPAAAPAARANPTHKAPPSVLPASVEVNGEPLHLDGLLYLKAAEHYVEVVFHDATQLVRTSLRDLVDRLHPDHGVQPHRSYWVSRDAIIGLNRQKGAQFLVLSNGDEIPVSRQRRTEVGDWVQKSLLQKKAGP